MKLRLPHKFQAALIAALASVSFTTLSTGSTAQAATTYKGVTYSGYIYNIATNQSTTFHDRNFTNYYSNDGGATWLTSTAFGGAGTTYYNGTEQKTTTDGKPFWRFTFGDGNGVKSTLRLTGATANVYLETQFSPFYLGGLIAEAGDYTYAVGRQPSNKDCALTLLAEEGQKANMSIASNVHLSARNGFTVASSGTWDVASGKTLAVGRYDSGSNVDSVQNNNSTTFNDGLHVDMTGGGTVDLTHTNALTVGQGTTISVGADTTLLFASATTLGGTITNAGRVTFAGTVTLNNDLSGFDYEAAFTDYETGTTGKGFAGAKDYIIINNTDGGSCALTQVTYNGGTKELTDGKMHIAGDTDYSTYYIQADNASMDLAQAITYAQGQSGNLTTVNVQGTGATITVGSNQSLNTLNILGGKSATVNGTGTLTLASLSLGTGSTLGLGENAHVTVTAKPTLSGRNITLAAGSVLDLSGYSSTVDDFQAIFASATGAGTVKINGAGERTFAANGTSTLLTNLEFTGAAEFNGHGYDSTGHTLNVGNGTVAGGIKVTNDLRLESKMLLNVQKDSSLTVGGNLIMGHSQSGHPGLLSVDHGTLSVGHIQFQDNTTANTITLANSTVVATLEGNLFVGTGTSSTVSATDVTLKSTGVNWAWNRATAFGGTLTVDAGSNTITLGAAGADFSVVNPITLTSGTVAFAGNWNLSGITHTGTTQYTGGATEGDVNGFASLVTELQLVNVGTGAAIGSTADAHFTIDGVTATLDATGLAKTSGDVNYDTFHVMTGSENVTQGRVGGTYDPVYSLANGTELVVDADLTGAKLTRESGSTGNATLNIKSGMTYTSDGNEKHVTITGAGTYALTKTTASGNWNLVPMVDVLDSTGWTGTVLIENVQKFGPMSLNDYGTSLSRVKLSGVTGWMPNDATFNPLVEIGNGGITLVDGGSDKYVDFAGGVAGTGNLNFAVTSKADRITFKFTGGVADWTGAFNLTVNKTANLVFSGSSTKVNATITRTNGTLNVEVGDGTAFTTTFNETVSASSLTVKAQTTATFMETVTMGGDINLNGNSTATFNKAVSAANLRLGDNGTQSYTGATATFNGTLTLTGDLTVNGTDTVPSSARLNAGGSVNVIDLSHGGNAHGTLTVAANQALTYSSSFWGANNNKLLLEAGATVKKATDAPIEIVGLEGGGYVSSSANEQFGLDKTTYTLHNVEATVNTDSDDVQLHFDNSKFVTSHTVTLKNTESVFSGMEISGGTTTVGASGLTSDTTVTLGAVSLSGGNLTLADHVIGTVNGMDVTASGTVTGGKLVMQDVITMGADATLALTGTTVDVSALPGGEAHPEYVEGQHSGSGFSSLSAMVKLVDFSAGGTVNAEGATFSLGSNTGTFISDSADEHYGYVSFADASYNAYYVNVAGQTESLDYAINTAAGHEIELEAVYLNGGTLNADVTTKVASLHINETADKASGNVSLTGAAANFGTVSGKGTLNVAADTTLTADTLSIAAGETLTLTGSENISFGAITNHGTLDIGTGTKVSTEGAITIEAGTSTITGQGAFDSSAKLTVDGGTVTLSAADVQFSAIDLGNGTLNISAGTTTVDGNVTLGYGNGKASGTLTVAQGATLTAQNVNSPWGFNSLTVDGTINATNQFSITTGNEVRNVTGSGIINTAHLVVGNQTTKAVFSGGLEINIGNGGITGSNGVRPLELHDVTVGVYGDSTGWSAENAITLGDTTTGTTFDIDANKEVTLSGAISGSGKLVKDGDGTLNLASNINNTDYTGNMEVKDGTLTVNGTNGNAFHSVSVAEGATVELIGKSNQDYRFRYTLDGGTLTSSGSATGGGNVQNDQITLTKSSTISGSANFYMLGGSYNETSLNLGGFTLTKEGGNTVSLINTDVSTGSIVVKDGTLNFVHRNDKPDSRVEADIELNGGTITGAYKYTDSETAVSRALTAKQDVTASAAIVIGSNVTLATNVDNGKTLTMSGAISGDGGLTKTGDGTLALTAAASYNGATAVDQGILALGSSLTTTGDVTVAAGAAITFANGATISANTLGLEAGATLDFSDYQGAIGSKVNVVTTTTGVTGFGGATIVKPAISVHGLTTEVKQEGNNIVLTFTPEAEGTMHLYILTGQSNSLGSVKGNPAPADLFAHYASGGLLYNGNMHKGGSRYVADPDWKIVDVQPRGEGDDSFAVTGPEYVFEYLMLKNGWFSDTPSKDSLGVIKASLDGGGDEYWVKDGANSNYGVILDTVRKGYEEAEAMGYANVTIDGLLYLQGESNGHGGELVQTRYTTFLANLKADLEEAGIDTTKILFGEHSVLGEPATWGQTDTSVGNEKTAGDTHTQLENLAKATEGIDFVYTRDLDKITSGDNMGVHYNGEAQITIGARYAYAFAVQNGKDVSYDLGNGKKGVVRGSNDEVALTDTAAWWGGTAPAAGQVAVWDVSSVSTPSPAVQLQGYGNYIADGATWTVGGIHVADAYKQLVTINGGTVSLGADGINLVGGGLSMTSDVSARESQTWQAANGHKLVVNGTTTIDTGATLKLADDLYLTFGYITGTGSLEIGTVTFDMDLDYMGTMAQASYISSKGEGANGYVNEANLIDLTAGSGTISFTHGGGVENITQAGGLEGCTLTLGEDSKTLKVTMPSTAPKTVYFTRSGEVAYTSTDDGENGIYNATELVLSGQQGSPATLTLSTALKDGVGIKAVGLGGTVKIGSNVVLNASSLETDGAPVTIAGSGEYMGKTLGAVGSVTAADVLGAGVTLASDWTGSVVLSGGNSSFSGYTSMGNLADFYKTGSTIVFNGLYGYFSDSYTIGANIEFRGTNDDGTGAALTYTAGNRKTDEFSGTITGKGDFVFDKNGGNDEAIKFTGNIAGWTGSITTGNHSSGTLSLTFGGSVTDVNAAITKGQNHPINVTVDATSAVSFNKALTGLSNLTLNASKSASVLGGIGTAATTLNSGASLTIGGTANSSLGTVTLNNNTALTIAGTGAVTAGNVKVADQCASTITLGNDLAMSQLDTIGANHTLSIGSAEGVTKTLTTGKLGFDNVGTVISLQNAHMVVTGAATAGVLDAHSNNRGTMTVGENATLDLQGTTQWNTNDSKYVDLVVKDGGSVSVSGGSENKIRNVNMGENGTNASLSFGAETHTAIANTNVAASAHASVSGAGNAVDFGNVNVGENAELSVMNLGDAASVSVSDVTIGAGATMGAYTGSDVSPLDEAALVIASGKTLTADNGATLNADLVMDAGSTLDVSGTGGNGLAMGSSVTLNPGVTLSAGDMAAITALGFMDQYTLFTGVDAFSYDGTTPTPTPIAFDSETWVKASEVFSNSAFTGGKDYYVFYSGAQNGSNVGAVYVMQLPEPTTGTLSLLALAALAARRRRK